MTVRKLRPLADAGRVLTADVMRDDIARWYRIIAWWEHRIAENEAAQKKEERE